MANTTRFIAAVRVGDGGVGRVVGQSLRTLRKAVGMTESQVAQLLGLGKADVAKIEEVGDVQLSTLQRYVEVLGGSLRVDATFAPDSDFATRIGQELGEQIEDFDQYVLPIFGSEKAPRRDFVISIKPFYSNKIFNGTKTVELRRRFPQSIAPGTLAYVYSSTPIRGLVGTAEILGVERLAVAELWKRHGKSASIRKAEFDDYFGGLDEGFALKISNPRLLKRTISLPELRERFGFRAPQSFHYAKPDLQKALQHEHSNVSD